MEKYSSNISGSSSNNSGYHFRDPRSVVARIPLDFWCGAKIIEKISHFEENPFRCYYRCWFTASKNLENDPHVFEWIHEAYMYEIQQLEYQVRELEEEIPKFESGRNLIGSQHVVTELNDYGTEVFDGVEEMLVATRRSIKKILVLVFGGFILVVVIWIFVKQ